MIRPSFGSCQAASYTSIRIAELHFVEQRLMLNLYLCSGLYVDWSSSVYGTVSSTHKESGLAAGM